MNTASERNGTLKNRQPDMTRQDGVATLVVTIMLAIIMAIGTLTVSRISVMEQRITGNDIRAREVQEAAEAGLEYAVAWARDHAINATITCSPSSAPTGCPSNLTDVYLDSDKSTTGEQYNFTLQYTKGSNFTQIISTAMGVSDPTISARSETWIKQIPRPLFAGGATMPPPWVMAGCVIQQPTGNPQTYLLHDEGRALLNGKDCTGYNQQGHLDINTWTDEDADLVKDDGDDTSPLDTFPTGTFDCQGTNCAWNQSFGMPLAEAKLIAEYANHSYTSTIPCGPAQTSPSIYVINNGGPITPAEISGNCSGNGVDSETIGAPTQPILMIIPAYAGCPSMAGGVTIYGIVYYESPTACATNGWGGATIYGSVIWEGDVYKPNANSEFIEVDYQNAGLGNDLNVIFNTGPDDVIRIPGTWKDF